MKKRIPIIVVTVLMITAGILFILTRHKHSFAEADCTTEMCGFTEDE